MGTESVNKWSCLHFSPAISEAAEQMVGSLCWSGELDPSAFWMPSAAVRVADLCVIHPVSSLHYSSHSLARRLAVCTRRTLLVPLLPGFSVTRQTSSLLIWRPPDLSVTQALIRSSGSEPLSLGWARWVRAGGPASPAVLFPLPPPASLPFPAGGRSAILEPSSTALLWQHRRAHTGGRGDVFITFPGDYLFKHFSDSYNNKGSVLCFPAEGHLLLKDV